MSAPQTEMNTLCSAGDEAEAQGGTVTAKFDATRAAWRAFLDHEPDMTPALIAAVRDGSDPEQIARAFTDALASYAPDPVAVATLRNSTAAALLPELRAEFNKSTEANYEVARQAYNKAAAALVKALEVVDPDTDPAALMSAPEASRKAWASIDVLTAEVEQAADRLAIAARHLGIDMAASGAQFALTCNAQGHEADKRRAVWAAWDEANGRGGRWAAMHRLGVRLEAPKASEHKPYRRPKPYETRYIHSAGSGFSGLRQVEYDPETNTPAGAFPAGSTVGL